VSPVELRGHPHPRELSGDSRPGRRHPRLTSNRDLLEEVADRLDSDLPVGVDGIATVNLLLSDGASPLWALSEGERLCESLWVARLRLDT
jgi:hypothetical protein